MRTETEARLAVASTERSKSIEGLRATAALSILISHVATYGNARGHSATGRLLNATEIGVTLFFVISGFLLYRPFLMARSAGRRIDLTGYARRRAFRIVPAYWVALGCLGIWPGLPHVYSGDWWRYFGFAQIYGVDDATSGIAPAWSLDTEISFYALLPLISLVVAAGVRRLTRIAPPGPELALLGLAALGSVLAHSYAVGHLDQHFPSVSKTLVANFDWFALGMMIAVVEARPGSPHARVISAALRRPTAPLIASATLFCITATQYEPSHGLQGISAALLLAAFVLSTGPATRVGRALSSRPMVLVGAMSYSVFLIHDPVARRLSQSIHSVVPLAVVTLAATLPLAWVSYKLVELPGMRVGRAGAAKRAANGER